MRTAWVIVLAMLLVSCAGGRRDWTAAARQQHPFGYFTGVVETRWNKDGRTMTLLSNFSYTDPDGEVWEAPAGSEVDGASIPRGLWSLMGGPFEGRYRNASVLHDVSYDRHDRPPKECDRMFYNAMRCSGVSAISAKTMYYALIHFGRHWKFPVKRAEPASLDEAAQAQAPDEEMNAIRAWIRENQPSMEQIEQRAENR